MNKIIIFLLILIIILLTLLVEFSKDSYILYIKQGNVSIYNENKINSKMELYKSYNEDKYILNDIDRNFIINKKENIVMLAAYGYDFPNSIKLGNYTFFYKGKIIGIPLISSMDIKVGENPYFSISSDKIEFGTDKIGNIKIKFVKN